ncbi:MAG TPA: CARDB domain-containing protein [Solirubrobacteraceae bacterium]|nr:CARDB domain-containing protein [Solirubrobacteraceae bacterium]
MRFLRLCIGGAGALAVAVAALAVPGAAGAAGAPSPPPRAQLAQFSCGHALDPANRSVSVEAVMRPLVATRRFSVKFELLQRASGAATSTALRAGDLGLWLAPATPTLGQLPEDVWRLNKTVLNLVAPAAYQFRVTFRWTGASGRVIGSAVRFSRVCHQQELRPDLAVKSLTVSSVAGNPNQDVYTALITNRGLTGAGPFEVLFVPGGGAVAATLSIPSLGAGRSRTVSFTGPVCDPTDPPTLTADAAHEVDDYTRSNNSATAVCPAAGGS